MEKYAANERTDKRQCSLSALAGLILAVLPTKTEALELPPGTDWFEGAKRIEQAAKTEPNEWATAYIANTNQTGAWVFQREGDNDSVSAHPFDMIDSDLIPAGETTKICFIHTHPASSLQGFMDGPSMGDLEVSASFASELPILWPTDEAADSESVPNFDLENAVFGPYGVWYYSPADRSEIAYLLPDTYPTDAEEARALKELWTYSENLLTQHFTKLGLDELNQIFLTLRPTGWAQSITQMPYSSFQDRIAAYVGEVMESLKSDYNIGWRSFSNNKTLQYFTEQLKQLDESKRQEFGAIWKRTQMYFQTYAYRLDSGLISDRQNITTPTPEEILNVQREVALAGHVSRFVTYSELKGEPPCAGARHEP